MLRLAAISLRRRSRESTAAVVAVFVGVSFLFANLTVIDSVRAAATMRTTEELAGVDARVRAASEVDAGIGAADRPRIDGDLASTVALDGVAAAEPFAAGTVVILDREGRPVGDALGQGELRRWIPDAELSPFRLEVGRAPAGAGEVVLDESTAQASGSVVGERVALVTAIGAEELTLVGVAVSVSSADPVRPVALAAGPEVDRLTDSLGLVDGIDLRWTDRGRETDQLAAVAGVLPAGVEVVAGDALRRELDAEAATTVDFFAVFLTAFSVLALLVAGFVVFTTFAVLVAQRRRELALLRLVGATRRQLVGVVVVEAAAAGAVGSVVGLAAGFGLARAVARVLEAVNLPLRATGFGWSTSATISALLFGTTIATASACGPALAAGRTTPVDALRIASVEPSTLPKPAIAAGLLLTGGGAVAVVVGLAEASLAAAGVGSLGLFVGIFVLGPIVVRPMARAIGWPLARWSGTPGRLGRENTIRSPRRSARTAAALMVGLSAVTTVSVVAASIGTSARSSLQDDLRADLVVSLPTTGGPSLAGFAPAVTDRIAGVEGVDLASPIRRLQGSIGRTDLFLSAVDRGSISEVIDLGTGVGESALDNTGVLLAEATAAELGAGPGDELDVVLADGLPQAVTVRGIIGDDSLLEDAAVSLGLAASVQIEPRTALALVKVAAGRDANTVRGAVASAVAEDPTLLVESRGAFIDRQAGLINGVLGPVYALLATSLLIAMVGIGTTVRLSVRERRRELGLLRAVGMTRRQAANTVRIEASITALIGATLGLLLGLFFGITLTTALRDAGVTALSVPWVSMGVVSLVAVLIGLAAASIAARRAARLDPMSAIREH
ncbi:MAG: ABC transporter permease [Actinomycetota bacterium]